MAINYIKYLQSLVSQSNSHDLESTRQHMLDAQDFGVEMQCFASAPIPPMDFTHNALFPFASDLQQA